jgi:peptidoglycan hydrolase-like protein with peptidoglycan-binding domain
MRRILISTIGLIAAVATAGVMLISSPAAGAATTSRAGPAHTTSAAALRWPTVKFGDKGNRVFAIQYLLRSYGYAVRPSGVFGGITRHDVAHFQRVRGIRGTGVVGSRTWPRLIVLVRPGNRGNAVAGLQQNLRFGYRYRFIRITGFYGPLTKRAVLNFQRRFRLPADALVGLVTWNTIIRNEK